MGARLICVQVDISLLYSVHMCIQEDKALESDAKRTFYAYLLSNRLQ